MRLTLIGWGATGRSVAQLLSKTPVEIVAVAESGESGERRALGTGRARGGSRLHRVIGLHLRRS